MPGTLGYTRTHGYMGTDWVRILPTGTDLVS